MWSRIPFVALDFAFSALLHLELTAVRCIIGCRLFDLGDSSLAFLDSDLYLSCSISSAVFPIFCYLNFSALPYIDGSYAAANSFCCLLFLCATIKYLRVRWILLALLTGSCSQMLLLLSMFLYPLLFPCSNISSFPKKSLTRFCFAIPVQVKLCFIGTCLAAGTLIQLR